MDRLTPVQLDRQLGEWLRDESAMRAPAGLVEDVFARTSRTGQARRWWPPRLGVPSLGGAEADRWLRAPALAAAIGVVAVAVGLTIVLHPFGPAPGTLASPSPSAAAESPSGAAESASPSPSTRPRPSSPAPTVQPTPQATTLGDLSARRLPLAAPGAPISVFEAFGSIWVAEIHSQDVVRFDPVTMAEIARIPVPGAAWFAVADDALWVTNQTGRGLSRIDPATNTVVGHVGDVPTCGVPVVAFGSLWQAACDAGVVLRIDPARNAVIDTIPAERHGFLTVAGGRLITFGPEGLASLDPVKRTFTTIGNRAAVGADFIGSDGTTVWIVNRSGVARIDPTSGKTLAGMSLLAAQAMSFSGDHAWLTLGNDGVLEIDLATNKVTRTIPGIPSPLVPLEAGGALWVTDFDDNSLWKIDL